MKIKSNSLYNLFGFLIPTFVLFLASRILIDSLGENVFGIYILATSFSGSLAILDLGFSSAVVKFIAEGVTQKDNQVNDVIATSLTFYGILGLIGSLFIWAVTPWLVSLFSIEPHLINDAIWVFRIASIQFSLFFLTIVFISSLKGLQRFDLSTVIQITLAVFTYGGAIIGILKFDFSVIGVAIISLVANLFALLLASILSYKAFSQINIKITRGRPKLKTFRMVFNFSSALMVHSLTSLFFTRFQRILIGIFISPSAVTIYFLAFTLGSKVHAVVNAVSEIFYPLSSATDQILSIRKLYIRMLLSGATIAGVLLIFLNLISDFFITFWVGPEIAPSVITLIPIFSIAFFFFSLTPLPYHLLNGIGRPWINAILDVINISIFLMGLGLFSSGSLTLSNFVWAYAISNTITALVYIFFTEKYVWKKEKALTVQNI